jgi:pyruvate/2-oxoglutarate dehydrogenase complex dihydrolipoamide dehydrogenase (E3) component
MVDLLYPALGCKVRSDLATTLGARRTPLGTLIVDDHQQTTVDGFFAIGDVVSDLHQIAVGTGHAALAATAIHNRLPRNPTSRRGTPVVSPRRSSLGLMRLSAIIRSYVCSIRALMNNTVTFDK